MQDTALSEIRIETDPWHRYPALQGGSYLELSPPVSATGLKIYTEGPLETAEGCRAASRSLRGVHKCVLEGSGRAKGVAWLLVGGRTTAGVVFAKDVLVTRPILHYLVDRMTCHIVPSWMQKDGFALTDVQCAHGETPSEKFARSSLAPSKSAGQ